VVRLSSGKNETLSKTAVEAVEALEAVEVVEAVEAVVICQV
jgi:hypothetical protein